MAPVDLDELRDLFAGVPADENDEWASAPCYSESLAFEIAKRCDARTEFSLRSAIYDDTASSDIPPHALTAIRRAAERYRSYREQQANGRGL